MSDSIVYRKDVVEALYQALRTQLQGTFTDSMSLAISMAKALPSAEPKTGEWIVWGGMDVSENHGRHKCSECGEFALLRYEKPLRKEILSDFCPNCGSRMLEDGWEDDE